MVYKVLTIGVNIIAGTAVFVAQKTKNITYGKTFSTIPKIDLVINFEDLNPVFKINVTTTGFTIGCKNNITGIVDWKATEM